MRVTNVLPIALPRDTLRRLREQAYANERDPIQQARWIIKQALGEPPENREAPETAA